MAREKSDKTGLSGSVKGYLIAYNTIQAIGWSYLLLQIIYYYISGQYNHEWLWDYSKVTALIFQNLAVLEILHVVLKFVKSNIFVTLTQVYSRVFIVSLVLAFLPEAARSNIGNAGVTLAFTCWAITEIVRYSYYALNLIDAVPYFLLWIRYSFFTFLYPFGVTGEMLCVYAAYLLAVERNIYIYEMPNRLNFDISYKQFLVGNVLSYIPGFPPLYLYMFTQRRKILGGKSESAKKQE